jgi:hypothetical protein
MSLIVVGVCVLVSSGTAHHNTAMIGLVGPGERAAGPAGESAYAGSGFVRAAAPLGDGKDQN